MAFRTFGINGLSKSGRGEGRKGGKGCSLEEEEWGNIKVFPFDVPRREDLPELVLLHNLLLAE